VPWEPVPELPVLELDGTQEAEEEWPVLELDGTHKEAEEEWPVFDADGTQEAPEELPVLEPYGTHEAEEALPVLEPHGTNEAIASILGPGAAEHPAIALVTEDEWQATVSGAAKHAAHMAKKNSKENLRKERRAWEFIQAGQVGEMSAAQRWRPANNQWTIPAAWNYFNGPASEVCEGGPMG
jgi:hypothetical protein